MLEAIVQVEPSFEYSAWYAVMPLAISDGGNHESVNPAGAATAVKDCGAVGNVEAAFVLSIGAINEIKKTKEARIALLRLGAIARF